MEEKAQFDAFLGGSYSLPHEVNIMDLASARAGEIAAMTYSINNPQQTKLIFQKLPLHMRRRVMSHNAKRLPRRLREAHLRQMAKSGLPPKSKRPSRKYRRRPRNLLFEYNRRKKDKVWLETHIWHAKRFHMAEKWGYKLADRANDKCFRANYRAVTKHCLMQDLSYYSCIEISGPETLLKNTLNAHCNPSGLTFAAKIYANGNREGILMFFARNSYPYCPIGNIRFLWKPEKMETRTIWIWVHPAFYEDVLNQLILSFEFEVEVVEEPALNDPIGVHRYSNKRDCRMVLLRNVLNRFRLYGPLTLDVLTTALQLPNLQMDSLSNVASVPSNYTFENSPNTDYCFDVETKSSTHSDIPWHIEYYDNQETVNDFKMQRQLWQLLMTLDSPAQLPRNIVLGFTVLDPRFDVPEKRVKCTKQNHLSEIMPMPPTNSNRSAIWDIEVRQKVTKSWVPNSRIDKLRAQCLIPGTSNDKNFNEGIMAKIPIIVIQNPGNDKTGLSSGVDVILPAGWAMPFWLAFVFRCTRVGALRECSAIAFENRNGCICDISDPDTAAYQKEALRTQRELIEKYFRYPPNRRVNFLKLGISSPFFCQWKLLTKEWSGREKFYVLRDHRLLSSLKAFISSQKSNTTLSKQHFDKSVIDSLQGENCLIRISVSILKKGCPKKFAIVCLPTDEDLDKLKQSKDWSGPVEKMNIDPYEVSRKALRKNRLVFLKRAKRQRIRCRKALANKVEKTLLESTHGMNQREQMKSIAKNVVNLNKNAVHKQLVEMSEIYLPDCSKVRYSCEREIMGYITMGDYSFAEAKGIGIGYITFQSLIAMHSKKSNIVLVRNTQTRQYRIAELDILIV